MRLQLFSGVLMYWKKEVLVRRLSVAIFINFLKCKFQHFSRFLELIFIVCRRRWVIVQLSAVVLAGIYPDGIYESCIFSEI